MSAAHSKQSKQVHMGGVLLQFSNHLLFLQVFFHDVGNETLFFCFIIIEYVFVIWYVEGWASKQKMDLSEENIVNYYSFAALDDCQKYVKQTVLYLYLSQEQKYIRHFCHKSRKIFIQFFVFKIFLHFMFLKIYAFSITAHDTWPHTLKC